MFAFIHTHRIIKIKIRVNELDDLFSCYLKNFQEDPKPLGAISKSQVEELVFGVDSRKEVVHELGAIMGS